MRRGDGVSPHPSQAHLPETKVRKWQLDTNPYRRADGHPTIPRSRWVVEDMPRGRALDTLHSRVARMRQGLPAIPIEEPKDRNTVPTLGEDTPMTLSRYVEERYLPWLQRKEPSTLANRRKHMKILGPLMGHMTLPEVATPEGIGLLYDHLEQATFQKGGETRYYKHTYKNQLMISLSAIITHASNRHTCSPPLCENISCPQFKSPTGRQNARVDGYSVGQHRSKALPERDVPLLLNACARMEEPDYYYVLVGLSLYAGCRVGEAAGRKWSDVDWSEGTLHIHSQISGETDAYVPYTKNKVERVIALAPPMLDALKRLQKSSTCEYILGPRNVRGQNHLINQERPYLSTRNMGDRYNKLYMEAFGRECRTYHALRHRYATSLADRGIPVHEIRDLCGHLKLETTYGYISPNTERIRAASRGIDYGPKFEVLPGGKKRAYG